MAEQVTAESNVNGDKQYVYIDTDTGAVGRPGALKLVDVAEGDLEYIAGLSPEQVREYGALNGGNMMSVEEAADYLSGINDDLRWAFLDLYSPQPEED